MPADVVDASRPRDVFRAAIGPGGRIPRDVVVARDASCSPEPSRASL